MKPTEKLSLCPECTVVDITPSSVSRGAYIDQKQSPANVALARPFLAAVASGPWETEVHTVRTLTITQSLVPPLSNVGAVELQRDAVHAIPEARRLGPVGEHVAQVPSASAAVDLGLRHEQGPVR